MTKPVSGIPARVFLLGRNITDLSPFLDSYM